jgi:hypothetical protein
MHRELLNTVLTTSIANDRVETALTLLDLGADPSLFDCLALRTSASLGQFEVAIKCMEKGANPCIAQGMVLHLATSHDQASTVQCILDFIKDKKIDLEEVRPQKALEIAAYNQNEKITKILLSSLDIPKIKKVAKNPPSQMTGKIARDIIVLKAKENLRNVLEKEQEEMTI